MKIYKGAIRVLGETTISSLSETRPIRYKLDEAWDDGFVDLALSSGLWNFALRTQAIEYTGAIDPDFGYQHAFLKPDDWIRTARISEDGYFTEPFQAYDDDPDYWFCDLDTLYVRYVSNDTDYGSDLSRWPAKFTRYAYYLLAGEVVEKVTQSRTKKGDIEALTEKKLQEALTVDGMNQPARYPIPGSWVRARHSTRQISRYTGGWR